VCGGELESIRFILANRGRSCGATGSDPDLKKQPPKLEGLFQSKTLPSGAPATDEEVRKTTILGIGTIPPLTSGEATRMSTTW
jgi:hypothetical protein